MSLIVEAPWARRGYEELASYYESAGQADNAEVLRFVALEKFGAEGPHSDEGQRGHDRAVP
jgi:hypothetical protein